MLLNPVEVNRKIKTLENILLWISYFCHLQKSNSVFLFIGPLNNKCVSKWGSVILLSVIFNWAILDQGHVGNQFLSVWGIPSMWLLGYWGLHRFHSHSGLLSRLCACMAISDQSPLPTTISSKKTRAKLSHSLENHLNLCWLLSLFTS